jgi:hypothetical protein
MKKSDVGLFNYTPLLVGGTDKNKQLTIIKPTQTGIKRNKSTFCIIKIIGAQEKFKTQTRPLVRLSSVNFCQNF